MNSLKKVGNLIGLRTHSLENAVTGERVKGTAINRIFSRGNMEDEQQISKRLKNEAEIKSAKKEGPLGILRILETHLRKLIPMWRVADVNIDYNRVEYEDIKKSVKKISQLLYIMDHAFPEIFDITKVVVQNKRDCFWIWTLV